MSTRDRQFIAATRREAAAIEDQRPGTLHKMVLEMNGRNLRASFFYNREHRESSRGAEADEAPAPKKRTPGKEPTKPEPKRDQPQMKDCKPTSTSQQPFIFVGNGKADPFKQPASTRPRTVSAEPSSSPKLAPKPSRQSKRADDSSAPMLSAANVSRTARTVKGEITLIVRSLGGDEESGAQHLCAKQTLHIGGHKHAFRVPVGSTAAKMPKNVLTNMLEAFTASDFPSDEARTELRRLLTPGLTAPMEVGSSTSSSDSNSSRSADGRASPRDKTLRPWNGG